MKNPNKIAPKRRIDLDVIREMASLVALKLSEHQAALKIGLNPGTWAKWKCVHKHDQRFADALQAFRAEKLQAHIQNIEQAAVGAGPHVRSDWRASSWLVERALSDDHRYSDRALPESTTNINVSLFQRSGIDVSKALAEVYAQEAGRKLGPGTGSPKALISPPEPGQGDSTPPKS